MRFPSSSTHTPPRIMAVTSGDGLVLNLAALGEHRRDQQVLRPRVGRALIDVQLLLAAMRAGNRPASSCRCPARRSAAASAAGPCASTTSQQASKLLEHFSLADPLAGGGVGVTQKQPDAVDFYELLHGGECGRRAAVVPLYCRAFAAWRAVADLRWCRCIVWRRRKESEPVVERQGHPRRIAASPPG